jgi:hypothetical protein
MKIKATKKEMREGYNKIVGIGYCNAQHLLHYKEPIAYSARTEGWACDYYDIGGTLISTGYDHLPNKNTTCDYALIKEYNDKALAITCNNEPYELQKARVEALLAEFIVRVTS